MFAHDALAASVGYKEKFKCWVGAVKDQFTTPAADETGRHAAVTYKSPMKSIDTDQAQEEQAYMRQRQDSAISEDSMTDISSEDTGPTEKPSGYCLCVPEPKIPRPRNAFILYRQHQHSGVVAQHPKLPNPDISKIIGEQWRQLSLEDKNEWKALAEQEKARHSQQFPDYRYRPRRNGKFQSVDASQAPTSHPTNCAKCGGKTMNPPSAPSYTTYEQAAVAPVAALSRGQKRGYTEAHGPHPQRQSSMVQVAPQTYPPPGQYVYPRRESVHYVTQPGVPPPPQQRITIEDPEAKRRRMNAPYPAQQVYDQQYYDRERPAYHRESIARPMPPPPPVHRVSHAGPHMLPPRGSQPLQRKDPSLTLAPLKTGVQSNATPSSAHPAKSENEPTAAAYPLLTKLKTLSSITRTLPTPGPGSPAQDVRGIIIAIEGLDSRKVNDMTTSLNEQLEKEGKFYVRTFLGPNPYQMIQSNRRASVEGKVEALGHARTFNFMSEWHKLNQEVVSFITHKPGKVIEVQDQDQDMSDVQTPDTPVQKDNQSTESPYERGGTQRSPISAISPGTVEQTSHMSLDTSVARLAVDRIPSPQIRVTRSRVPQAALDARVQTKAASPPPPPPPTSTRSVTSPPPPCTPPLPTQEDISNLIPVAIIPHYQLTTVDTCSNALPITDNYDPLTHWRWHATLWRGCTGPDISIVIDSDHEEGSETSTVTHKEPILPLRTPGLGPAGGMIHRPSTTNVAPPATASAHPASRQMQSTSIPATNASSSVMPSNFNVEVRLQDYRAVIVKTSTRGSSSSSPRRASTVNMSGHAQDRASFEEKENEHWEKAKRRVGFEVAEWMRR